MNSESWVALAALIVVVSGAVGSVIWNFGRVLSRLETKMDAIADLVPVIRAGQFPVCVVHEERLAVLTKILDQHTLELERLWTILREDNERRNRAEPERVASEIVRVASEIVRAAGEHGREVGEHGRAVAEHERVTKDA